MKIVVLDGYALNPGDLSWSALESVGQLTVYDRTPLADIHERAKGADVLFTNKTPLTRDMLVNLPDLRYVGVFATGYNIVDTVAAKELNIRVTNVPGYSTMSVAQQATTLLLELTNATGAHDRSVHAGDWVRHPDYSYSLNPLIELAGRKLGIIGYGAIGSAFGRIGAALGMSVIALERANRSYDVPTVSLADLATTCDVVSLHCPLTPETQGIVSAAFLEAMKPTAYLINTSRGPLVDEVALANALNRGSIAGAGLDVLAIEPPKADNPLLTAKNCVITPHIAWATFAARTRLMDIAVENLRGFISGELINAV